MSVETLYKVTCTKRCAESKALRTALLPETEAILVAYKPALGSCLDLARPFLALNAAPFPTKNSVMASRKGRSAAWSGLAELGVTSFCGVLSSVLVLLTSLTSLGALAWKDEGHMLVAAVAREYMKADTVQKVEGVLALWKPLYPRTSTLEYAAVWMDHIICSSPGEYCNFEPQDNMQLFNKWHFCNVPWNPQKIPLRLIDKVLPLPYSGADWVLPTIYSALQKCKPDRRLLPDVAAEKPAGAKANGETSGGIKRSLASSALTRDAAGELLQQQPRRGEGPPVVENEEDALFFQSSAQIPEKEIESRHGFSAESAAAGVGGAGVQESEVFPEEGKFGGAVCSALTYSLYLRVLIHVFGDIHQPLHASEVFSRAFPKGDYGGNRVYVNLPDMEENEEPPAAREEATGETFHHNLHGEWDSAFGQYAHHYHEIDPGKLRQEAKRLIQAHPVDGAALKMYNDFLGIIKESNKIAREYAYKEFDWKTFDYHSLPYKPTKDYVKGARIIAEERIALGGARLAALLDSIAQYLPSVKTAPRSLAPASAWETPLRPQVAGGGWFLEETLQEQWLSLSKSPAALTRLRKRLNHLVGGPQPHGVESGSGQWRLSVEKKGEEGGVAAVHHGLSGASSSAISSSLGIGLSATLVLLLTSIVALFIAWRQLRTYKRALQVVLQRGAAAAAVSGPVAAAAEAGDWQTAAALLGGRQGEPQVKEHACRQEEEGSDVSTALDSTSGFDVTSTARLLTCKREI